jgi:hypothetical protein
MSHGHWKRMNQELDPDADYLRIYRNVVLHEYPWDMTQSLSFALFRTYAVPSIGGLLARTGEFDRRPQKRYDDTVLLLEKPAELGFEHPQARAAIKRVNRMHRSFDISNDDLRYVLSAIVVSPVRWIARFGKRPLTPNEVVAVVRYGRELGLRMGIKEVPERFEQFADLLDRYEAERFAPDAGGKQVGRATLDLLCSFYPAFARPAVDRFSRALMDPPLRAALGFDDPGWWARTSAHAGLRLRARLLALAPDRRTPRLPREVASIRSYPNGFEVARLGTFPQSGCGREAVHDHGEGGAAVPGGV